MDIGELNQKRAALLAQKGGLMDALIALKQRLTVTLPKHEYLKVEAERARVVGEVQKIDAKLSGLNVLKHGAAEADWQKKRGAEEADRKKEAPWIRELCALRDGYQEFAADGTRSPTMRRMASEFVLKLKPIIRRAISRDGDDGDG